MRSSVAELGMNDVADFFSILDSLNGEGNPLGLSDRGALSTALNREDYVSVLGFIRGERSNDSCLAWLRGKTIDSYPLISLERGRAEWQANPTDEVVRKVVGFHWTIAHYRSEMDVLCSNEANMSFEEMQAAQRQEFQQGRPCLRARAMRVIRSSYARSCEGVTAAALQPSSKEEYRVVVGKVLSVLHTWKNELKKTNPSFPSPRWVERLVAPVDLNGREGLKPEEQWNTIRLDYVCQQINKLQQVVDTLNRED